MCTDGCVMGRVGEQRGRETEGEVRKTGRDNMGGKTVDRREGWLGGMKQSETECMR